MLMVHESFLLENEPPTFWFLAQIFQYHVPPLLSSGAFYSLQCLFWPTVSCEPDKFEQFSKITPNALTFHTKVHSVALWSQAFMFTEQNILQGSSSPSHTAGECHGFIVENISFNKASTELHRKWKISINTASLVVHIPAAVSTIDSADPKHISPASHSLTASTITAATSPMFGFPVLCSCCWGRPQAIVQGTNILTHFLWGDSTKSVSHISTVFKKTGGSWSEPKQALHNI